MADFKRRKIQTQKTVGEILKIARKKKGYTFSDAEENTKVRAKYLEALEEGRYDILPGGVYANGFLVKYADYLDLDKEAILTQFKAERGESDFATKLVPDRRIKDAPFFITPRLLMLLVVILIIAGILSYIVISVRQITNPPNLVISSPSSEQVIKEKKVEIVGKTDQGATLQINDQTVLIDDNGNFSQIVKLNPGLNTFEVKAINRLKKERVLQVKVLAEY